jgi:SAM-dependent methyltransferase
MTPTLFDQRQFCALPIQTRRRARLYDRYVQSRDRYKRDLFGLLTRSITGGPVLELNDGFGNIGVELLRRRRFPLHLVCASQFARVLTTEKLIACALMDQCHISIVQTPPFPYAPDFFALIYAVNALHTWADPTRVLVSAWRLLQPGGHLILNDLRRDADPFITEYLLREMAADKSVEGRYRSDQFVRSLQTAYTCSEVALLLRSSGLEVFSLDTEGPMTFTILVRKKE